MDEHRDVAARHVEYRGSDQAFPPRKIDKGSDLAVNSLTQNGVATETLAALIEEVALAFDEILNAISLEALASLSTFLALRAGPSNRFLVEALLPRVQEEFPTLLVVPFVKGLPQIESIFPHVRKLSVESLDTLADLPEGSFNVFCDADTQAKALAVLRRIQRETRSGALESRVIVLIEIFEPMEEEFVDGVRDLMRKWLADEGKTVLWLHSAIGYTPRELLDQFQNYLIIQPTPAELDVLAGIKWMDKHQMQKSQHYALAGGACVPKTAHWRAITLHEFDSIVTGDREHFALSRAVILAALPVEYKAIRLHLTQLEEMSHRGTVYERGYFLSERSRLWEVLIAEIGPGNKRAAVEAERAINYFNPRVALFVGVAGGVKPKDAKIGDVVAATKVYGYESGKADKESFKTRPEVMNSSHSLEQRARVEMRRAAWLDRIKGDPAESIPRAFVGPIAAGEKVVRSTRSAVYDFIRNHYNDALAVEMEGIGFLVAVHLNENVKALVVRGISDLLDDKDEADEAGYQDMAARHASAFAFQVLARLDLAKEDQPTLSGQAEGNVI